MNKSAIYIIPEINNLLAIKMPYDRPLLKSIRSIPDRKWNPESKIWYVPNTKRNLDSILEVIIEKNDWDVYIGTEKP